MPSFDHARVLALVVLFGGAACNPADARRPPEGDTAEHEPVTPVLLHTLTRGGIQATLVASSTIEAERKVTVHAETTGRVLSLAFEEGDRVREGQRLARIAAEVQASGLDRAARTLAQAQQDLATVERLFAQNVASRTELDTARRTFDAASQDVRDRRRDVGHTTITAPFGGTVTERFVSDGTYVAPGQQLLTIVDFSTLVARVFVPEKELDRIAVGQPAAIAGKAARDRKGTGRIARIAPVVDAQTGTIKVTVALPEHLAGGEQGFLPGMYAEVTLTTERRDDALLVPRRALVRDDEAVFVFVVRNDRAERARLELGLEDRDWAEVRTGLEPGDAVVVAGQAGLKDGALVRESGDPP